MGNIPKKIKYDSIIFDLDGTLITSSKYDQGPGSIKLELSSCQIWVTKRPGFDELMEYCFSRYNVGIWSSGKSEYVNKIIDVIFKDRYRLKFVYTYNECICTENNIYKIVSKSPFKNRKTLIIEDNIKYITEDDIENVVLVPTFNCNNKNDRYLYNLADELKKSTKGYDIISSNISNTIETGYIASRSLSYITEYDRKSQSIVVS